MSIEQRLSELGLTLPPVAAPVAAYIPALISGDLLFTSGQLPFVDGRLPATGKVGEGDGLVSAEQAYELARLAGVNALAAAHSVLGDLDRIVRVVKVTGFVASDPTFTGQPGVINGVSELYGQIFAEAGQHTRSAVGVGVLPLDSPVEVEAIFQVRG